MGRHLRKRQQHRAKTFVHSQLSATDFRIALAREANNVTPDDASIVCPGAAVRAPKLQIGQLDIELIGRGLFELMIGHGTKDLVLILKAEIVAKADTGHGKERGITAETSF